MQADPTKTTVRELIDLALQDSGMLALGQSAGAEVYNKAFKRLNMLIAYWATKRWFSWRLVDASHLSSGAFSYTVGQGGDFNVGSDFNSDFNTDFGSGTFGFRPQVIEKAFARLLPATFGGSGPPNLAQPVDYPLIPLLSREDYADVRLKFQTNFPTHWFYDPTLPLGTIYFWPSPLPNQFEMHILVRQPLPLFSGPADVIYLPPEYAMVLQLSLARWLRTAAKMPADSELNALLRNAVNGLKNNNTQVPNLGMPSNLTRAGIYNILADEWH